MLLTRTRMNTQTHTHGLVHTHSDICRTEIIQWIQSALGVALRLPSKLDILVDRTGDHHGDNGVVPGAEEHESETQAHPQERQSPKETDGDSESQA